MRGDKPMNRKTRFIAIASIFLAMLCVGKAQQQETKSQPPEGAVKILEAIHSNSLEHITKPDDWRWLIVWVELQPPGKRS
jgi:hypothetical protein